MTLERINNFIGRNEQFIIQELLERKILEGSRIMEICCALDQYIYSQLKDKHKDWWCRTSFGLPIAIQVESLKIKGLI